MRGSAVLGLIAVVAVAITLTTSYQRGSNDATAVVLESDTAAFKKHAAAIAALRVEAKNTQADGVAKAKLAKQAQAQAHKDATKARQLADEASRNAAVAKEAHLELGIEYAEKAFREAKKEADVAGKEDSAAEQAYAIAKQNIDSRTKAINDAKDSTHSLSVRAKALRKEAKEAQARGHLSEATGLHDRQVAQTAKLQLVKLAKSAREFSDKAKALLAQAKAVQARIKQHKAAANKQKTAEKRSDVEAEGYVAEEKSLNDRLARLAERDNLEEGDESDAKAQLEVQATAIARRKAALIAAHKAEAQAKVRLQLAKDKVKADEAKYNKEAGKQ